MTTQICTTGEFWRHMCRPGFVRTSLNVGVIGATVYYAPIPPECASGFLDSIIGGLYHDLGLKPLPMCSVPDDIQ